MHRKLMIAGTAAVLSLAAATANAQRTEPRPWYGGLDLGRSRLGLSGGDVDNALSAQGISSSSSVDRSATAYGLNLGYRFTRNFALEGAYAHLGKFGLSSTVSAPAADTIQGSYKANALSLSAVGILPLQSSWSVYGKAGLARTRTELDATSVGGATAVSNTSDSTTGLLIGAGATYDFASGVFAKAGWDHYTRVGSDATGKGSIGMYSLGIGIRF